MTIETSLRDLIEVQSPAQLLQAARGFAAEQGFAFCSIVVVREGLEGVQFLGLAHSPEGYGQIMDDLEAAKIDPVSQHLKSSSLPLVWGRDFYANAGAEQMWELYASYGMSSGIAQALHLGQGRHLCLGFECGEAAVEMLGDLSVQLSTFQLYSAYALEAARRVLFPLANTLPDGPSRTWNALEITPVVSGLPPSSKLTQREIDCLRWSSIGKTGWEIGKILDISEDTVKKHFRSIEEKLECANRQHAIACAIRHGLIP